MARTHVSDSEDDLPDLEEIINKHIRTLLPPRLAKPTLASETTNPKTRFSPTKKTTSASAKKDALPVSDQKLAPLQLRPPTTVKAGRPLKSKSVFKLPAAHTERDPDQEELRSSKLQTYAKARATPRRGVRKTVDYAALLGDEVEVEEEEDIEESIWCGSSNEESDREDSEFGLPTARKLFPSPRKTNPRQGPSHRDAVDSDPSGKFALKSVVQPASLSDKENDSLTAIRFSPPTAQQKPKATELERPSTPPPPTSPPKSRLVSPSKKKSRIPTPPHRPSIDAFWSVHQVNEWNDQYSPEKPLLSPKKSRFMLDDDSSTPISSPRKLQSPIKRTKAEIEAKKGFESRKHALAASFLDELDHSVTDGKIAELAARTGGVRIIWSKTLNTTAGRANWKRETTRTHNSSGDVQTTYKHTASIELAEKVIDDEERLLNVIAHEFCHLANFMVSGIKDQPHGKSFKAWGAKCTSLFGSRGVEVTTKHSYQIEYKYIWQCVEEMCGHEHKRHSKSIDPKKHLCGVCRGRLVQVKPVPRKKAGEGDGVCGYAAFVKENFANVKKEMGKASHKEVMEVLGRRYREQKAAAEVERSKKGAALDLSDVAKALEVITLDDD